MVPHTTYKYDIDLTKYTTSLPLPVAGLGSFENYRIYVYGYAAATLDPSIRAWMRTNIQSGWAAWVQELCTQFGIGGGGVTDNYYFNKIPNYAANPTFLVSNNNITDVSLTLGTYALIIHDELSWKCLIVLNITYKERFTRLTKMKYDSRICKIEPICGHDEEEICIGSPYLYIFLEL